MHQRHKHRHIHRHTHTHTHTQPIVWHEAVLPKTRLGRPMGHNVSAAAAAPFCLCHYLSRLSCIELTACNNCKKRKYNKLRGKWIGIRRRSEWHFCNFSAVIPRVKWCQSNLWSRYDLHFVGHVVVTLLTYLLAQWARLLNRSAGIRKRSRLYMITGRR